MSEVEKQPAGDSYEQDTPPQADDPLAEIEAAYSFDDEGIEVFSLSKLIPMTRKIEIGGITYDFDGEIMLDDLLSFVRFEETRAKQKQRGAVSSEETVATLVDTRNRIREMLVQQNPNIEVPEKLRVGAGGISLLITHLMGGKTAVQASVLALSGGGIEHVESQLEELKRLVGDFVPEDENDEIPEGEQVLAPLVSEKPSSAPSSASPSGTTGPKTGGRKRASARSKTSSRRRGKKS